MSTINVTPTFEASCSSHANYRNRYSTAAAAARYPSAFADTWKDRADRRAILKGLANVPHGARVLDLPCGAGRLTTLLTERGYAVCAADVSPHMVARASEGWNAARADRGQDAAIAEFSVQDVLHTGYTDKQFDAIVCNRLFHHFNEPEVRQAALREFARICRGPIIVSFSNTFSLDSPRLWLRWMLGIEKSRDGLPIRQAAFAADGIAAGLTLERMIPTRWALSPLWYAVFRAA